LFPAVVIFVIHVLLLLKVWKEGKFKVVKKNLRLPNIRAKWTKVAYFSGGLSLKNFNFLVAFFICSKFSFFRFRIVKKNLKSLSFALQVFAYFHGIFQFLSTYFHFFLSGDGKVSMKNSIFSASCVSFFFQYCSHYRLSLSFLVHIFWVIFLGHNIHQNFWHEKFSSHIYIVSGVWRQSEWIFVIV